MRGSGPRHPAPDTMCGMPADDAATRVTSAVTPSLYREIDRAEWARLAADMPQPLAETEIVQIRGLGDRLDMAEVREVYLPLSRLLILYAERDEAPRAPTRARSCASPTPRRPSSSPSPDPSPSASRRSRASCAS